MNIEKRYWKWDEALNQTEFKLGGEIDPLISAGLVKQGEDLNEFSTNHEVPWVIRVRDGKITHIFYRETFDSLLDKSFWELELKDFERAVSKMLQPCKENEEGDTLGVIFRDYFVAVTYIKRSQKNEP